MLFQFMLVNLVNNNYLLRKCKLKSKKVKLTTKAILDKMTRIYVRKYKFLQECYQKE